MARRKPPKRKRKSPPGAQGPSISSKKSIASGQSSLKFFGPDWEHFRNHVLPVIILIAVTVAAYANAWPNNLVADDPTFAQSNRYSDLDLTAVFRFFTNDVWGVTGWDSGLYRPLLLVSIMIDSLLFGDWVAGYHLTNIFLHVLTTLLLYGLVRHLLMVTGGKSPLSQHVALLAAIIFGVHPIHTEVLNSIFNRSDILVSLGFIGGTWWFLRTRETRPRAAWFGLGVVYLMVLLCKESGATLPALTVMFLWVSLSDPWPIRFKKCLPVFFLVIPLAIYVALRVNALDHTGTVQQPAGPATELSAELAGDATVEYESEPGSVQEPSRAADDNRQEPGPISKAMTLLRDYDTDRVRHAVRLWADSLKLALWPHPLRLYHGDPETPFWMALGLQALLLAIVAWVSWNRQPVVLAGLIFFYVAMMPASGLIGSLGFPKVAERFLYFPTIGLTIMLAFGLYALAERSSLRLVVALVALVTVLMMPLNWARNAEWATDIKLNEAEYRKGASGNRILGNLVLHNLKEKNVSESTRLCDVNFEKVEASPDFSYYCGLAYEAAGRFDEAKKAYTSARNSKRKIELAYLGLALLQVRLGEKAEAKENFEQAIELMDKPFLKHFHTALMLVKLYPSDQSQLLRAKSLLEQTIEEQPEYFPARLMLQQLDQILASGRRFESRNRQ